MGKLEKLKERILSGTSDANIDFKLLCKIITRLGFRERIRGDHHVFSRPDIDEILNLQPMKSKAKPYQVKQIRNLIIKYRLGDEDVE